MGYQINKQRPSWVGFEPVGSVSPRENLKRAQESDIQLGHRQRPLFALVWVFLLDLRNCLGTKWTLNLELDSGLVLCDVTVTFRGYDECEVLGKRQRDYSSVLYRQQTKE